MASTMTKAKWEKIVADMLAEWHRVDTGREMRRYAVLWWDNHKGLLVHWYETSDAAWQRHGLTERGSFATVIDWHAERQHKAQEAAQ